MVKINIFLVFSIFISSAITSNLQDLYKILQDSKQEHGKFVRPQRNKLVSSSTSANVIKSEKKIDADLENHTIKERALSMSDLRKLLTSENESNTNKEDVQISPETWLKKFYRKTIIPRRMKSNKSKGSLTTTAATTTTTIKTESNIDVDNKDYDYVIFVDDLHDFSDSPIDDGLLPLTDFNTIEMYNELFKINKVFPTNEKLIDDGKESKLSANSLTSTTTAASSSSTASTAATTTTTERSKSVEETPTTLLPEIKDNLVEVETFPNFNTKAEKFLKFKKRKEFRNQLKHFYNPKKEFPFRIQELKPFENDFKFDFSRHNPVEDIQNKMVSILKQNNFKSEKLKIAETIKPSILFQEPARSLGTFDGFDDYRNTKNLHFTSDHWEKVNFQIPDNVQQDLISRWVKSDQIINDF